MAYGRLMSQGRPSRSRRYAIGRPRDWENRQCERSGAGVFRLMSEFARSLIDRLLLAYTVRPRRAGLEEAEPGGGRHRAAARSAAALIYERLNSAADGLGVGARGQQG